MMKITCKKFCKVSLSFVEYRSLLELTMVFIPNKIIEKHCLIQYYTFLFFPVIFSNNGISRSSKLLASSYNIILYPLRSKK